MLTQTKRPFSFDEMIGQAGILSEMRKRSKDLDFPEVMIFSGNSGTGKTTLAYIISAILNDPNPMKNEDGSLSPNPDSLSSKSIREEKFNRDVKLYDASSMGKDDVIKLGESLSNAPMYDKHKVVIIDEAQELSKAGKGVVLELLEKKRKGTYIILCTMALESFDKAVRSRGQIYHFRSPSPMDIAKYLFNLTKELGIEATEERKEFFTTGLFILAENCEGSIRMAVQNFERCIYGEFWTEEQIEKEFSFISEEKLSNLLMSLLSGDTSCIKTIKAYGTKDFYYKAMKVLNDAFLYQQTGYLEADWKKDMAKRLDNEKLESIVNMMLGIDSGVYFREDVFFFTIAKYFKEKKSSEKKVIRQRVQG